jgi:hypothetical protein
MNPGIQDGAAEFVRERMHWIWESLAEKAGIDEAAARKMAARNICEVMLCGYKSKNFVPGEQYCVPSQDYSFELVRNAVKAKKLIIIMRCQKLWQDKVPELITHEKEGLLYTLKNNQRITISPGNIPDSGFDKLIETIRARPTR